MARITFIENRGKTRLWQRVGAELAKDGHAIGWIVQNPLFAPPSGACQKTVLPFPRRQRGPTASAAVPDFLNGDRGRAYFGAGADHYDHYRGEVARAFDALAPDIVIGEPTLFHEMIALNEARQRAIPYLHPAMNRYPGGRFAVFDGDTQNPVAGSQEVWDQERLRSAAEAIGSGAALPSYMLQRPRDRAGSRQLRRATGLARTFAGRLAGERFNTPSLSRKHRLQRGLKASLHDWSAQARLHASDNAPVILYPLQMQPEANIDVWGQPFSDQIRMIERLAAALPVGGLIAVKANPKSKYEVSATLLKMARARQDICLLPLDCSMAQAQDISCGAVTVSGTVGLEAVFGRGRCLSLRHPILQQHFPDFHAPGPEEAVRRLLDHDDSGKGNIAMGSDLLARLIAESFPGVVSEPLYDPSCLSTQNVKQVADGLRHVIARLGSRDMP